MFDYLFGYSKGVTRPVEYSVFQEIHVHDLLFFFYLNFFFSNEFSIDVWKVFDYN